MAQGNLAGPIGQPLDRVDGRLKVTGQAQYAYEYAAQGEAAYGFIVSASIGKGRVIGVDVTDAEHAPGVLLVLTKDNAPAQTPWGRAHRAIEAGYLRLLQVAAGKDPAEAASLFAPGFSWQLPDGQVLDGAQAETLVREQFAPFEEPELYARELREFFRPYRASASADFEPPCG